MMRHILLTATALSGLVLATPAMADDFRFIYPNANPFQPLKTDERLVIELPESLSAAEMNTLFLELNGVDITQMVTLEGRQVIFYPSSPYASGTNKLRLVKLGRNGKLVEIERWAFNVAGDAAAAPEASVRGQVDAQYNYMVWDDYNRTERPERSNLSGQGDIYAQGRTPQWDIKANANGFFDSEDEFTPGGDNIEVGNYLVTAARGSDSVATLLSFGHHDIGADNILMDNFLRRGVSAKFDIMQGYAGIAGFAQNPAPAIGNSNFTGLGESDQRVYGLHATLHPFGGLDQRLELEGTVYKGDGGIDDSGTTAIESPENEGDGFQIGFKTSPFSDFMTVRGQYAKADYDYGFTIGGDSEERDEAYSVTALFKPLTDTLTQDGRIRQWNVEAGYQRTGTFFQSLLNPYLDADRETWSLRSAYLEGGFSLDGELTYLTNNVNDLAFLPEDRALNFWTAGSYAPEAVIFGAPVFSFGGGFSDEKRLDTPTGYAGNNLDQLTWTLNGGISMTHENVLWSLNHTYTNFHNDENVRTDYDTQYTDLTAEWRVSERLTLKPGLQLEFFDEAADDTSRTLHLSLGAETIILPGKFWNNTDLSTLVNTDATNEADQYRAETEFTWLFRPAALNQPGYALAVSGLYDSYTDSRIANDIQGEDARVFVRLKLSAPFSR